MTKLEEIARAIERQHAAEVDKILKEGATPNPWHLPAISYGWLARAAVEAMRRPTEPMVSCGDWVIEGHDPEIPQHAWNVWESMIDAILNEKPTTREAS
jgi:hypothetical protein